MTDSVSSRGDAGQGVQDGQADDGPVPEELDQVNGLVGAREIDEEADVLEPRHEPGRMELAEAAGADGPLEDDAEGFEGPAGEGLSVGDEKAFEDAGPGPVLPGEGQGGAAGVVGGQDLEQIGLHGGVDQPVPAIPGSR